MNSTLPLYCDLDRTSNNRDIHGDRHSSLFPQCYKCDQIDPNLSSSFYFTRAPDPILGERTLPRKYHPTYVYKCPNVRRTIDAHHIRKPVRVRREAHPFAKLHIPLYITSDEINSVLLIAPLLALPTRFLRRQMFYCLGEGGEFVFCGPFTCTGRREFLRAVVFSAGRYPGKIYDRRSV